MEEEHINLSGTEAFEAPEPERKARAPRRKSWTPRMGPLGTEILNLRRLQDKPNSVLIKLLYGERFSSKTNILLHDMVTHCHIDMRNPAKAAKEGNRVVAPLAIMCAVVRGAATEGGAWEKLHTLVAPEWYDNLGIEITPPKMDDQKNRYCFIQNRFGGWSRVVLKSIPYGEAVGTRFRGIEMSYFLFEEITLTDDPDYLFKTLQQMRRPTGGPKIWAASCNPAELGEEHWVWQQFVIESCKAAKQMDEPIIPEKGGRLQGTEDKFAVYYVPIAENPYGDDEKRAAWQETVRVEARLDPTAWERLGKGKWVARPAGAGLLVEYYVPAVHLKGDFKSKQWLYPKPGFPITISYDLGQVWSSATFEQLVPTMEKPIWLWVDEADHFNERILYKKYAWEIIEQMFYWCEKLDYPFTFLHVADESAINQWRPGSGSFDARDLEREFEVALKDARFSKYLKQDEMRILGCPKPAGSVASRVRLVQTALFDKNGLAISAKCVNCISMINHLTADKNDPEKPRKSKWLHKFDSASYGMFRELFYPTPRQVSRAPRLTAIGT